jgi:hypothetical protein
MPPSLRHAAVVFVFAVVTFLPALSNGLIGDDSILLEQRLDSAHAPALLSLVQQDYWGDLHESGTYRPLSLAMLFVERQAFGFDPRPYRAINLLLHAICSVLVLQLLRRLASARAALAGALLFAVHPIHAEAVMTIYGQADLWCAVFFLGALVAASCRTGSTRSLRSPVSVSITEPAVQGARRPAPGPPVPWWSERRGLVRCNAGCFGRCSRRSRRY